MGNCSQKSQVQEDFSSISKSNFDFLFVLGKGGYGKVWKVYYQKDKQFYAMKEMSKILILNKKSVNSVMNERKILQMLRHDFIINMVLAFQNRENLYLVLDLLNGGDLRFHLCKRRKFSEQETKFFVACIVLGLEYIHLNGVLHRDIKPENIVIDSQGYLKITDFGVARIWQPNNAKDTSGTPGYMAPEVLYRLNHGFQVDYFALGVITFECMMGHRPYIGNSRKEIKDLIFDNQVQLSQDEIPTGWSIHSMDFVNRLILRKPQKRLGSEGSQDIKNHPWFDGFDWNKLQKREMVSPMIPNVNQDNFYIKQSSALDEMHSKQQIQENEQILKNKDTQRLFVGYNYEFEEQSYIIEQKTHIHHRNQSIQIQEIVTTQIHHVKSKSVIY